jgi:hypothetical protein
MAQWSVAKLCIRRQGIGQQATYGDPWRETARLEFPEFPQLVF